LDTKATEFGEMTQSNGHYAIQSHRFWYQSKAIIRLPILPPILHCFQVMADYMSNFR